MNDLVNKFKKLNPDYSNGYSNHLSMAIYSLNYFEYDIDFIEEYCNKYIEKNCIEEIGEIKYEINDDNFSKYLGVVDSYSSYVEYFSSVYNDNDQMFFIEMYLNKLIKGYIGGLFHGLIRLSYAIKNKNKSEIINSLAYLASHYKETVNSDYLDNLPPKEGFKTFSDLSKNQYYKNYNHEKIGIIDKITDVIEDENTFYNVYSLDETTLKLDYFYQLTLNLYTMTGDLYMLHAFTVTHAIRILSMYISDLSGFLQLHFVNLQLLYLATNCIEFKSVDVLSSNLLSWKEIIDNFKLKEEFPAVHDLKLLYSLIEQSKVLGNDQLARLSAMIYLL